MSKFSLFFLKILYIFRFFIKSALSYLNLGMTLTNLKFSQSSLRGYPCKLRIYDRILAVKYRIVSILRWLMTEFFWSYTFSWMIVYFERNDHKIYKCKDRMLYKILYRRKIIVNLQSWTFTLRVTSLLKLIMIMNIFKNNIMQKCHFQT